MQAAYGLHVLARKRIANAAPESELSVSQNGERIFAPCSH